MDGTSFLLSWLVVRHPPAHLASLFSVLACTGHVEEAHAELDEVIVSATRQETRLQQTPMSVRALTSEELELAS